MSEGKYDEETLKRVAELVSDRIASQFKAALESIEEIKHQVAKLPTIHEDTGELSSNMKAIKQAIKETNEDLRDAEARIAHLETNFYNSHNLSLNLFNNEPEDLFMER